MRKAEIPPTGEWENAQRAFERVRAEIEAVPVARLSPHNVDISKAASVVLGALPRLMTLRDRAAALAEFDVANFDKLADYATAAWFLSVTDFASAEGKQDQALLDEARALRKMLMLWARPLAATGVFAEAAIAKISRGRGIQDMAGDLVALASLFRSGWSAARGKCGVTEEDLARADALGPALFEAESRKDQARRARRSASLAVRQAWTLLDLAYRQCQRAVAFLRYADGDAETFAPSLRRNAGVQRQDP